MNTKRTEDEELENQALFRCGPDEKIFFFEVEKRLNRLQSIISIIEIICTAGTMERATEIETETEGEESDGANDRGSPYEWKCERDEFRIQCNIRIVAID